jgi:hypothetical protein
MQVWDPHLIKDIELLNWKGPGICIEGLL